MRNIYLYKHIRLDNDETFYIGIGNKRRPHSTKYRNKFWHNIVNKYGYKIEILYQELTLEEAKKLEIELISFYGRKDLGLGTLVNMTDGGEGTKGMNPWNKGKKLNKNHKLALKRNSGQAKKVICIKTNKIWNSGADCARDNKINYVTLMQNINGTHTNKTTFKFLEHGS